tara:strand:+ start:1545 stop:1784 length:240 start_codon:yes stop_codon:yes gene_type:complete
MLERLTRGSAPSLINADRGNELIDAINGLMSSRGLGSIVVEQESNGALAIGLNVDTIDLIVCVDGAPVTKKFLVANQDG